MDDQSYIDLRELFRAQLAAELKGAEPDDEEAILAGSALAKVVDLIRKQRRKTRPSFAALAEYLIPHAGRFDIGLGREGDIDYASSRISANLGEVRRGNAPELGSLFLWYCWKNYHTEVVPLIKALTPAPGKDAALVAAFLAEAESLDQIEGKGTEGVSLLPPALPSEKMPETILGFLRSEFSDLQAQMEGEPVPKKSENYYRRWVDLTIEEEKKSRSGSFDFRGAKISKIPRGVVDLDWIKVIDISNTLIDDFNEVLQFENLEEIYLSSTQVKSIAGVQKFPSLRTIYVNGTLVSDLWPLAHCHFLQEVKCPNTPVDSIAFARYCPHITELVCSNAKIESLDGLQVCRELKKLDIERNLISSIEELFGMKHLEYLDISRSLVRDLSPLGKCDALEWLLCDYLQLDGGVGDVMGLKNLEHFSAFSGRIHRVSPSALGRGEGDNVLDHVRAAYRPHL